MAYSKQFKEQAIALVSSKGYDPSRAARELGMPDSTLRVWLEKAGWRQPVKQDRHPQMPAAPLSDDPDVLKVRVKELEAQVRRLQMEKDILKKATAYFASQNP
jgi:transposase